VTPQMVKSRQKLSELRYLMRFVDANASDGLGMDPLEYVACDVFQASGGQSVDAALPPGGQTGFPLPGTPIIAQERDSDPGNHDPWVKGI